MFTALKNPFRTITRANKSEMSERPDIHSGVGIEIAQYDVTLVIKSVRCKATHDEAQVRGSVLICTVRNTIIPNHINPRTCDEYAKLDLK